MITNLTNEELVIIYNYLTRKIDRDELSAQLKKTRTNTYYYIGRAAFYWIRLGILKFRVIKDSRELGGDDV